MIRNNLFFVIAIALTLYGIISCGQPASAEPWQIKAGAVQGITANGETYGRITTILENPSGDALWELAPDGALYELVYVNDGVEFFNQARLWYDLGSSDNFRASALYLNRPHENSGVGFVYNPSHWNHGLDWLYDFDVSAWVMEGGGYTLAFDGNYEFSLGYGLEAHMLAGLKQGFEREYIDGRISLWHNLEPDGSLFMEAGYEDRADTGYFFVGVGGNI